LCAHDLFNLGNSGCSQHWRRGFRLGIVLNVMLNMIMRFGYGGGSHRLISLGRHYNKVSNRLAKAFHAVVVRPGFKVFLFAPEPALSIVEECPLWSNPSKAAR
jgi:hypothetical protein